MRFDTVPARVGARVTLIGAALAGLTGCDGSGAFSLGKLVEPDALTSVFALPKAGDTILVSKYEVPSGALDNVDFSDEEGPAAVITTIELDLATGTVLSRTVASEDDEGALFGDDSYWAVERSLSAEGWSTQLGDDDRSVTVANSASGATATYGLAATPSARSDLVGISNERLAVAVTRITPLEGAAVDDEPDYYDPDESAESVIVIIELPTGEAWEITGGIEGIFGSMAALQGDWLAFQGMGSPADSGSEYSGYFALEAVNLATRGRHMLDSDYFGTFNGFGEQPGILISDQSIIWGNSRNAGYDDNGNATSPPVAYVDSFDLARQTTTRLLEVVGSTPDAQLMLTGFNSTSALISEVTYPSFAETPDNLFTILDFVNQPYTTRVSIHGYDGSVVVLTDTTSILIDNLNGSSAAFFSFYTEHYAVALDPVTREIVTYSLETNEIRRIDPFAE